ncbi:hypothetical protein DND62_30965 [Pseudomonas syringae pv. pisi]|nr:hypothetical protein DND62_30965 [Pseudomonas syringae pv. pisi]
MPTDKPYPMPLSFQNIQHISLIWLSYFSIRQNTVLPKLIQTGLTKNLKVKAKNVFNEGV